MTGDDGGASSDAFKCVRVSSRCGTMAPLVCRRDELHVLLGGALTFVGTFPGQNIVALARETSAPDIPDNAFPFPKESFDLPVRGDVVLIKTDADGNEVDLMPSEVASLTSTVET